MVPQLAARNALRLFCYRETGLEARNYARLSCFWP